MRTIANPKNNKTAGIIRLVVLLFLIANQGVITFGYNPLPFSEEEVYEFVSLVALAISGIWSWWKHAVITKEAKEAQVVLERNKANK